ncbi:glycosyltransferase family 4 protein [Candidatus Saccharibacteria bacterium]|nr:glycosyltransferase family 4 protein [Candidatus Saccharibacteria bacterium]
MRVLEVCSLYSPHAGGVETMTQELNKRIYADGHEVVVLTKKWPDTLLGHEIINDVPVYRLLPANAQSDYEALARSTADLATVLAPDVIHTIGVRRPMPMIALMLGRRYQVPVLGTVVGSEVPDVYDTSNNWIWESGKENIKPSLLQFDVVNAVSRAIATNTIRVLPELETVDVLPVGIDSSAYDTIPPSEKYLAGSYIFSLRRLEYSKGVDLLIDAYASLIQEGISLDLVIAGEGPEEQTLRHQVEMLGITEKVHFLGKVALDNGIGLLKSAAMTVVPSRSEGGGLINTEANAVGCPLIATDVGGIREYTSGDASFLIEPNSPNAIKKAIKQVLDDRNCTESKVLEGRRISRTLDWDIVYDRYKELYEGSVASYIPRDFVPWSSQSQRLNEIIAGTP